MSEQSDLTSYGLSWRMLTPRGPGAVAVYELRGAGCEAALATLCATRPRWDRARRAALRDERGLVDEILVLPAGSARIELHTHGSPAVESWLRARLAALGAREDQDGDVNPWSGESLSAVQAEALRLLPRAATREAAGMLLDQLAGAWDRALADRATDREALARTAAWGLALVEPRRVVLAGPANAGKSTLFNALYGGPRVRVDALPGTTLDLVEDQAILGPFAVKLCDGAGERSGDLDELERQGLERAHRAGRGADIVLWVRDASGPFSEPPTDLAGQVLRIANKCDLSAARPLPGEIALSALDGRGLDALVRAVVDALAPAHPPVGAAVVFTRGQQKLLEGMGEA